MIKMGSKVTDSLTGFTGTVTGRAEYLNGCISYRVEAINNGSIAIEWIDEQRLTKDSKAKTGGPQSRPPAIHP